MILTKMSIILQAYQNKFMIFSRNIESINAKIDEKHCT